MVRRMTCLTLVVAGSACGASGVVETSLGSAAATSGTTSAGASASVSSSAGATSGAGPSSTGSAAAATSTASASSGSGHSTTSGPAASSSSGSGHGASSSSSSASASSGAASSGGTAAATSTSGASATSSSTGGAVSLCSAASNTLAWTNSVSIDGSSLVLTDIKADPSSNVVVAAQAGNSFQVTRWSAAGAQLSAFTDTGDGDFSDVVATTGLFVNPSGDAFYGVLRSESGASPQVQITLNCIAANGSEAGAAWPYHNASAITGASPTVTYFVAGGDGSGGLHAPFLMGSPQYLSDGVYCYQGNGGFEGISGQAAFPFVSAGDFLWVTQPNGLALFKQLSAAANFGGSCTTITPATGGGAALAMFDTGGGCTWSQLLDLPTANVKATNFRLGADGSLLLAVVFDGSINLGNGTLTATGPNALALARFTAGSTGATLDFAKPFGSSSSSFSLGSLDGNSAGDVVLTAGYTGTVNLGGSDLPASDDTVLAVFDSSGILKWNRTVTVGGHGTVKAAAADCGLVLATDSPSVNLGTGALSTSSQTIGVAALGL